MGGCRFAFLDMFLTDFLTYFIVNNYDKVTIEIQNRSGGTGLVVVLIPANFFIISF